MRWFWLCLLLGCSSGGDFASAESVDAGAVAPDAIVELDARDAGAEVAVELDAGVEVLDVAGELAARDAGAGEAEAGPPPLSCKSIDGTGMCSPTGPWPYPCCRSSPCECCNKPNCGL